MIDLCEQRVYLSKSFGNHGNTYERIDMGFSLINQKVLKELKQRSAECPTRMFWQFLIKKVSEML